MNSDGAKGRNKGSDSNNSAGRYSVTFLRRARRALQVLLALGIGVTVWVVGFSAGDEPAPLLPNTGTQFSLDLNVINTADHDLVYAVEQRARPFYRILSLDPRTGDIETIYTVPEKAIIYGIALNPAKDTLAIAYSTDFELAGNGIWTLDLASKEVTEIAATTVDVFLTDIAWTSDGNSILVTHVDRTGSDELLGIAQVSPISGSVDIIAADAINPVEVGGTIYHLTVDAAQARRSIGLINSDGTTGEIEIGDSNYDLDHLLPGRDPSSVLVAVIAAQDGGLSIGQPAAAHGNHDVASSWWTVALDPATEPASTELEPIIVYDGISTAEAIVYATNEGLAIGTTERTDLIKSRAIRFVAA